jgi:hypothetical protein
LNEFSRISKEGFLLGVNVGEIYDSGKKYIENWSHPDFNLLYKNGSIYRWGKK